MAVTAILAAWAFRDRPAGSLEYSLPLDTDVASQAPELRDTIPVSDSDQSSSEGLAAVSESASQQGLPENPLSARTFEQTWVDHQPDPGVIEFDALKLALDAERIDTNWGPLMEAAVMGTISQNQANLLTLTIECKTTICEIEVKQAGELPPGRFASDVEAMFMDWFKVLGRSVRATGLDYWRVQLAPPSVDQNVTTWSVWILRTAPASLLRPAAED